MKTGPMRARMYLAAMVIALVTATNAMAWTVDPTASQVGTIFAGRPVEARCYDAREPGSPDSLDAWGYVEQPLGTNTWLAMQGELCTALADINAPQYNYRALSVLVLVHESYHLRRWGAAGSEAKVECKAIRHWRVAARLLGATEETVAYLWPSALAAHNRIAAHTDGFGSRPYYDPTCKVPK